MNKIFLLIFCMIFIGCSSKNIYVKENFKIKKNAPFLIINPVKDPLDLAYVFKEELTKRLYNPSLVHKHHSPSKKIFSQGSGFFINEEGLLLTNHHVIKDTNSIRISTVDNKKFTAEVIAFNIENDIAILKPLKKMRVSKWLEIDNYLDNSIGDKINVIGYPLSSVLGNDVRITQGIISSNSGIGGDKSRFQISASIQPGNSGGPIINEKYGVVGMVTSRLSDTYLLKYMNTVPQNINFGVKSNKILALLKKNKIKNINSKKVSSLTLKDSVLATVIINANSGVYSQENRIEKNTLKLIYQYNYFWEFDTINYLSVKIVSSSGEVLANGTFSGDTLDSPYEVVKDLIKKIFEKIK